MTDSDPKKNPVALVKGLVDGVRQWFANAEQEEREYRMELIRATPPRTDGVKDLLAGANPETPVSSADKIPRSSRNDIVPNLRSGSTAPPAAVRIDATPGAPNASRTELPLPPVPSVPLPPPPQQGGLPMPPGAQRPVTPARGKQDTPEFPAGMGRRKDPMQRDETNAGGVRVSRRNDTSYLERNQTVLLIKQHYAKYGHTISSAMLTKCLMPRGIILMLEKMGMKTTGTEVGDHEAIVQWVEQNGIEALCQVLGVRYDAAQMRDEATKHAAREENRRRVIEDAKAKASSADRPAAQMPRLRAGNNLQRPMKPSSPAIGKIDIKPISLPPEEPPNKGS